MKSRLRWLKVIATLATILIVQGSNCIASSDEWKSYTSMQEVRSVAIRRNVVWAATSGGMFSYDLTNNSFTQFTTSEGLRSIDLTAIAIDSQQGVWTGTSNGFLHRYLPKRNTWQYVTDIYIRTDPQKSINRLTVTGDTLIICSDIGVSLFSISRMEFISTCERYGSGSSPIVGTVTGFTFFGGKMWVATESGLASTSMTNTNPAAPESWQVYTSADGLPSSVINDIAVASDSLFVATQAGLAVYTTSGWSIVQSTIGFDVVGMIGGTQLNFITATQEWSYSGGAIASVATGPASSLTSIARGDIVGSEANGVLQVMQSGSGWKSIIPAGPSSNLFVSVAVDSKGTVWAATGNTTLKGFMSYDGSSWKLYDASQYPILGDNNYYHVSIGRGDAKWVSNWGMGVALLDDAGNIRRVFNTTNGMPVTANSNNNNSFIVVGGVATDQNGVAWITNRAAPDSIAVMLFHPDSTLDSSVRFIEPMRNPAIIFSDVVIDYNGTKWFANFSRFEPVQPSALYYYNENVQLPDAVNGWGSLSTSDGLTSDEVWSLAVDRDGEVWIGTDEGINIIYYPSYPEEGMASYNPLSDQVIQAIVVDALNDKWIATKQGVFVLSPDGTSILHHYTVDNTDGKLLSNDVASIAIDSKRGIVYFGTIHGLSSLHTLAVEPQSTFSSRLAVSPNPYYIPSSTSLSVPDTIDGLVEGCAVKILTVDGALVRELSSRSDASPGGRLAVWDGRNDQGEFVATGIYIIVAYSDVGNAVATGKVAVVRK